MYLHKENRELFRDAILLASQKLEDIDITFTEHLGEARRKKLKYNILKPIADELGLVIGNFDSVESDKNLNHYDFYYDSVVGDRVSNAIPPYVKLETSLMSYAFPT